VRSLSRTSDVRVIQALVWRLFMESRAGVETAVDEALAALCGPAEDAARADLQSPEPTVRLAAVERAISEPRLALALLRQLLEAPSEDVKAAARRVLVSQGCDPAALARAALRLPEKSEARRVLAIHLVVALRADDAVGLLDALLQDGNEPVEVYRHAASGLARLGGDAARAVLERHAASARAEIAETAKRALGS
jgi:hypothetical protein